NRAPLREVVAGNGCPQCPHRSGTTPSNLSTCSTGSRARHAARCPDWPPRFRPEGGAFGRADAGGGSDEEGQEEFAEVWPRRASRTRTRSGRTTISAWAADGVADQMSGGRGRVVSSIARGIRRHGPGCNPQLAGELRTYSVAMIVGEHTF